LITTGHSWTYVAAGADSVLSVDIALASVAIGALAMASAIGLLVLHNRFCYPDVDAARALERR
jgi:hypothetical protein